MRIREIPDELHKDFKIMCVDKKISMNDLVIQLMKEAVEKYKQKKL